MFRSKKVGSTHVIYVVDHSGSMAPIWEEMKGALRANLEEVQKSNLENYVSLIMFDNVIDTVLWRVPAKDISYDQHAFIPRGSTAMLDAVGLAVTRAIQEDNEKIDNAYYFVIISDGYENSSREYSYRTLSELVKKANDTGRFTITYIGSQQDLMDISDRTNIDYRNTLTWDNTRIGTQVMGGMSAGATSSYFGSRAAGATAVDDLYDNINDEGAKGSTAKKAK